MKIKSFGGFRVKAAASLLLSAVGVLLTALLFVSSATAQNKVRIIDESKNRWGNEPVSTSYFLDDVAFDEEDRTRGDSSWLNDLVVRVENNSTKPIIRFHVALVVEKQGTMPNRNVLDLTFPAAAEAVVDWGEVRTGPGKAQVLDPGLSIKMRPRKIQIDFLNDFLKKDAVEDLDRIVLDIRSVEFDDGSRWAFGKLPKRF